MKKTLQLLTLTFLITCSPFVYAAPGDGSIKNIVEVNSLTTNGPALANLDDFGQSMANIGDLNNDGVDDLVVGVDSDAFFILFMNSDGSVDSTVKIDDSTPNGPSFLPNDAFGYSLANIGDLNDDGVDDIAAGEVLNPDGGSNRGAIHIMFMNTDGSIDSTVKINSLTPNGPILADEDRFGFAVAGLGDLNGDDVEDIVVGAQSTDTASFNEGAIHILFMNTDGSVDSTVKITEDTTNVPAMTTNARFGWSIANMGDLDGDDVIDIAVGSAQFSSGNGTVYVLFLDSDGSVKSTETITLANSEFGSSVANIGDLDEDGVVDMLVTDTNDNGIGSFRGAGFILFMNTDGSFRSRVKINDESSNGPVLSNLDRFGSSATGLGDFDGDGVLDIAIGASGDDTGGGDRGAIYIMYLDEYINPATLSSAPSDTITTSCSLSDTTVTTEEEVDIKITAEMHKSNLPYTFTWTRDMPGNDEDFSHTFDTPGTYTLRGMVKNNEGKEAVVRCDDIVVTQADEEEEEKEDSESISNNNTSSGGGGSSSNKRDDEESGDIDIDNDEQEGVVTTSSSAKDYARFTTLMSNGSEGLAVLELQQLLNSIGFTLATTGVGSPGNETTYYGALTTNAVMRFQTTFSIEPADGTLNERTRDFLNTLMMLKQLNIL